MADRKIWLCFCLIEKKAFLFENDDCITFNAFREWYKKQIFYQEKVQEAEEEAEHAATLEELLDWPDDSDLVGKFW